MMNLDITLILQINSDGSISLRINPNFCFSRAMPSLRRGGGLSRAGGWRRSPAELRAGRTPPMLDPDRFLAAMESVRILRLVLGPHALPDFPPARELPLAPAGFSPGDVAAQLDGRSLKVAAQRETQHRAPDGCCSRGFREVSREVLLLPDDADLEGVSCALSEGGQLRIEVPRRPRERLLPIQRVEDHQTGGQGDQAAHNDGKKKMRPREGRDPQGGGEALGRAKPAGF